MYKLVNPMNIDNYWSLVAPWIAQAIDDDPDTWVDLDVIHQQLNINGMQLWIGENPIDNEMDVVAVTEAMKFGGRLTLVIRWLSGKNVDNWVQDIGVIEYWAKDKGFADLQIWGRRGWERKLRPLGYKHVFTAIGRNLERGMH
jgi:hypothetical protein